MRKYLLLVFAFISSALFFLQIPSVFNQNILADNPVLGPAGRSAPKQVTVNCTCDHANQMDIEKSGGVVTSNLNTYTCKDSQYGTTGMCGHHEEVCIQLAPGQKIPNNAEGIPVNNTGSAVVSYAGIACQTTVTCECNNKNQVVCTNPVLEAVRGTPSSVYTNVIADCNSNAGSNNTNKCEQSTDFQNTNLKTVAWNQPAPGAECQVDCPCDHPGVTGTNNNGWGHTAGSKCTKPDYCGNREDYCQNDDTAAGGHVCVPTVKCVCSGDKTAINCSAGSGPGNAAALKKGIKIDDQNETQTFQCGGPTCISGPNVDQPNFSFKNQHITGIECNNTIPTLPPPPSPPCLTWSNGVCTAFGSGFGSFSTNPDGFIEKIFAILLSVSGGIALLLIIKAGYQMMTAQGNPEKLNNAREQLVAAIVGLVFLIFSFVFLQLIGFDILHIPGFAPGSATSSAGGNGGNSAPPQCAQGTCINATLCQQKNAKCNTNGCPQGEACEQ